MLSLVHLQLFLEIFYWWGQYSFPKNILMVAFSLLWTNFHKKVIKFVCYFLFVKNDFSQWSLLFFPKFSLYCRYNWWFIFNGTIFLGLRLVSNKFLYSLCRVFFFFFLTSIFQKFSYQRCFRLNDFSIHFFIQWAIFMLRLW